MKIKTYLTDLWAITKKSAMAWFKADPFRQSAVVAYYAIFSMPALLVIVIACAGFAFGQEAVQGKISAQISSALGSDTAKQIQDIIAKSSQHKKSVIATIISIITLFLGCTGVFQQLKVSLNHIWEVEVSAKKMWLKSIKDQVFSFGLVLTIGFLLLVSLLMTTGLNALSEWIKHHLPDFMLYLFAVLDFALSFSIISVLFAMMFKILPDVHIRWKDVWAGAIATCILFLIGQFALGIYFGKAKPESAYGAAGSIILVMLWVSYSCMIVFFGAEFTKQFTIHFGGKIEPTNDAKLLNVSPEQKMVQDKNEAIKDVKK